MAEQSREARRLEETLLDMLLVLARAYQDPIRPKIREEGMDERDLAFEAGLLDPVEVDLAVYATQKRGRVLRLIRELESRDWVETQVVPPQGAYNVLLKPAGVERVRESQQHSGIPGLWDQLKAAFQKRRPEA